MVATDNNMLYTQYLHRKLQHAQQIQICGQYHIADVAMNKYFARLGTSNAVGRYAAVATANPHNLRMLMRGQPVKVIRVFCHLR